MPAPEDVVNTIEDVGIGRSVINDKIGISNMF